MKNFLKKLSSKKLRMPTEDAAEILRSQKSTVTTVSSYLEKRKNQNGFGEDFEITLRPRGTHDSKLA